MGLFQRFKKDKGEKSVEETARSERIVELLNKTEGMRDAFTTLSDIYGGEVIGDLTTPILEAFFSAEHMSLSRVPASGAR